MHTIRRKLLMALLAAALLPVVVMLAVNYTLTEKNAIEAHRESMRSMTREVARELTSVMKAADSDLQAIGSHPTLTNPEASNEEKQSEFQRIIRYYTLFSRLTLLSPSGSFIESSDEKNPGRRDQTKWFQNAMKGQRQVSQPEVDLDTNHFRLYFSVYQPVVPAAGGEVMGVVKAAVKFDAVSDILTNARLGSTGHFLLVDDYGNVLFHPDASLIYKKLPEVIPALAPAGLERGEVKLAGEDHVFESEYLSEKQTLMGQGWRLYSLVSRQEATSLASSARLHQSGAALLSMLVALVIGLIMAKRISAPIARAARAATRVSTGDLSVRLDQGGSKEMAEFATAFNDMAADLSEHRDNVQALVDSQTVDLLRQKESLKKKQADLDAVAAQLRAAYESIPEAVLVLRTDGTLLASNQRMKEFFGVDPATVGGPAEALHHCIKSCFTQPDQFASYWRSCLKDTEALKATEMEIRSPKNRSLEIFTAPVRSEDGSVIARLWLFRDMSEQRTLEMNLRHAQKMDAVGRLAGGVAHDFNNVLQAILGNLALIRDLPTSPEDIDRLNIVQKAGKRATEIVKQLMTFSRLGPMNPKPCNLNLVLSELENFVKHTLDRRITVTADFHPDLWPVKADATQIEQVIMNMVVNARDALPEHGGRIEVSTRNVTVTPQLAATMHDARDGEFVRISVNDNGSGMTPEVMSKIFEPFFTTKEQGKGTGLGLATSFGIVQHHGGWLTCQSAPGRGTTFHVFIPRLTGEEADAVEATPPIVLPLPAAVKGDRGKETVLLVDDELGVRAVAEGILKIKGYKVVVADNGEEALEILGRMDGEIDLVMLDLTMPKLSGAETFAAMRRGNARNIPVLICSGYLLEPEEFQRQTGYLPDAVLQKPYDIATLAKTVREVLDGVFA